MPETERTKRVTSLLWTTGLVGFFGFGSLSAHPSWPLAAAVAAVSALIGTVAFLVLGRPR